jgi:hypothetical protein
MRRYPIRKVTTPVPVEGGIKGGALAMSRQLVPRAQEPERIGVPPPHMAGVQEEAKHAMSAMSPLKSCDVEKPQPQR